MKRSAPGSTRGLTVLELVVTLIVLVGAVLLIAVSLVGESGERLERSAARAVDRPAEEAFARLRVDVRSAHEILVPADYDPLALWYEGPLVVLATWHDQMVTYGLSEEERTDLLRVVAGGENSGESIALRGVERFRWRFVEEVGVDAVEIEITYATTPTHRGSGFSRQSDDTMEYVRRLVVTPRVRPGATWW